MTKPSRRRETVKPYFAGFVIEGKPDATLADAQRLVTERLVAHVARQVPLTAATSGAGEAAD